MVDHDFASSNKHNSPIVKHIIWSFNGGKFDYLFLIPILVKRFKCEIIGGHT
jgi:hypothetical protein